MAEAADTKVRKKQTKSGPVRSLTYLWMDACGCVVLAPMHQREDRGKQKKTGNTRIGKGVINIRCCFEGILSASTTNRCCGLMGGQPSSKLFPRGRGHIHLSHTQQSESRASKLKLPATTHNKETPVRPVSSGATHKTNHTTHNLQRICGIRLPTVCT